MEIIKNMEIEVVNLTYIFFIEITEKNLGIKYCRPILIGGQYLILRFLTLFFRKTDI